VPTFLALNPATTLRRAATCAPLWLTALCCSPFDTVSKVVHTGEASKTEVNLRVKPVRVRGADGGSGERGFNVIADEEVAVADLRGRVLLHDERGDHIDFGPDVATVAGIDAVTRAGSRADAAAARTSDSVEVVASIGQPEGMIVRGHG